MWSRPKLAASSAPADVTMFQPARPPLMWSREAKLRARRVRLVVTGRRRRDQADVLGRGRHRRQQRDRLEDALRVVLDAWPHREPVGKEHRIQLAAFGDSRKILEVCDVADVPRICTRMTPCGLVVADSHEERVEMKLP
jgi:hypothetical protein